MYYNSIPYPPPLQPTASLLLYPVVVGLHDALLCLMLWLDLVAGLCVSLCLVCAADWRGGGKVRRRSKFSPLIHRARFDWLARFFGPMRRKVSCLVGVSSVDSVVIILHRLPCVFEWNEVSYCMSTVCVCVCVVT